jgi:hypothetical protein
VPVALAPIAQSIELKVDRLPVLRNTSVTSFEATAVPDRATSLWSPTAAAGGSDEACRRGWDVTPARYDEARRFRPALSMRQPKLPRKDVLVPVVPSLLDPAASYVDEDHPGQR